MAVQDYGANTDQIVAALLAGGDPNFFQQQVEQGAMAGSGVSGGYQGGGNDTARYGALIGEGLAQVTSMQQPPQFGGQGNYGTNAVTGRPTGTPGEVERSKMQSGQKKVQRSAQGMVDRSIPQDLRMAEADYYQAGQTLMDTRTKRFNGGILGLGESIYDLVRSKDAKKEFQESRTALQDETIKYEQSILEQQAREFQEQRQNYITAALPMLETKIPMQPGQDPAAYQQNLQQVAAQAFADGITMDKLFPDQAQAPQKPVAIKYIDQKTGAEMEKFIDPTTGSDVKGENFAPRMVAAPSEKTTGSQFSTTNITDETGTWEVTYGPYDANGVKAEVSRIKTKPPSPVAEENVMKPIGSMPGENRKNMGLAVGANGDAALAIPQLFDTDGSFKRVSVQWPGSPEAAALRTYKAAVSKALRLETGAAKSDSEIAEMAQQYTPGFTDSNTMAMQKVKNFDRYLKNLHDAYTAGYDLSEYPDMMYVPVLKPWEGTQVAQEVAISEENAALDAELAAALQAAGITQ